MRWGENGTHCIRHCTRHMGFSCLLLPKKGKINYVVFALYIIMRELNEGLVSATGSNQYRTSHNGGYIIAWSKLYPLSPLDAPGCLQASKKAWTCHICHWTLLGVCKPVKKHGFASFAIRLESKECIIYHGSAPLRRACSSLVCKKVTASWDDLIWKKDFVPTILC